MTEAIYPLKVCPWCKETPRFYMDYDNETWLPKIECINIQCSVHPCGQSVPIRKSQKRNPEVIRIKIEKTIKNWNENNPMSAKEGIELNFDLISEEKQLTK